MTTQLNLTDSESEAIQALSLTQGKTEEELLHEAIEQFLSGHQSESRLALLRQARGLWKEREDLPDFAGLREEWDRF